jgi:uncharacterized protein
VHEGVEISARWETWDGIHHESACLRFENGGWTADSTGTLDRAHAVLRLAPDHRIRQFLLFRDLEQADLWLGHDGTGGWGEINGVHRQDLAGTEAIDLESTPLTNSVIIRGLLADGLEIGESYTATVAVVAVETLGIVQQDHVYERLAGCSWRISSPLSVMTVDVDDDGIILDVKGRFRRLRVPTRRNPMPTYSEGL